jgi:hypothetical protein
MLRVRQAASRRRVACCVAKRTTRRHTELLASSRGALISISTAIVLLNSGGSASAAALSVQEQQKVVDEQVSNLSTLLEKQREKAIGTVRKAFKLMFLLPRTQHFHHEKQIAILGEFERLLKLSLSRRLHQVCAGARLHNRSFG